MSRCRPPYLRCASCVHVIVDGRCRCSNPKDEDWQCGNVSAHTALDSLKSVALKIGCGSHASANDIPAVLEAKICEAIDNLSAQAMETRQGGDAKAGSVRKHDSAVEDAPKSSRHPNQEMQS